MPSLNLSKKMFEVFRKRSKRFVKTFDVFEKYWRLFEELFFMVLERIVVSGNSLLNDIIYRDKKIEQILIKICF